MRFVFFLVFAFGITSCTQRGASKGNIQKHPKNKILTEVKLTGVQIQDYPKYNPSGERWDAFAPFAQDPDIYLKLVWNENVLFRSETFEDTPYGKPLTLAQGLPADLKPFDQTLLVELFDEDGISGDDNLGYIRLDLMKYRDWKQIDLNESGLRISLTLEWIYE